MERKINLLILADTLEAYGGSEKEVLELVRNLNGEKYALYVSSLIAGGKLLDEIRALGAQVNLFPVKRIYSIFGIMRGLEFIRFLRDKHIDAIMLFHFGSDVWGTIFGRLAGVRLIISNRRDIGFWRKWYHHLAYRLINRWVDVIIANSNAGREMIIRDERIPDDKVKVIYNGIALKKIIVKNEKSGSTVIGYVGNFNPVKGHEYLLRAAVDVIRKVPSTHFLLVGDGPLKQEMVTLVERLGISKSVTFTGARNDIPELLSMMDICVLPSLSEGLSNSILEYMAASKPIIATKVGGTPELIEDRKTGLLVEPKNTAQLSEAIIHLIDNREEAKRYGEAARRVAEEKFSLPRAMGEYDALFREGTGKRLKVLHLISSNGLFGAEKVLLDLAGMDHGERRTAYVGAMRNMHNPHLEIIGEADKRGLNTVIFDSRGRFDLAAIWKVAGFLRKNKTDIIHTHNYKSDIIGFLASRITGTRWIATNHVWHGIDKKLKMYELLDGFILRFAEKVIAVSEDIRSDLLKKGIDSKKVMLIHNGIDTASFENGSRGNTLKTAFGIKDSEIVVTAVGRLSTEKGHDVLLHAAEKVLAVKNNIKFLIVGDGPLKDSLRSMVRKLQLEDKVIFTGIRQDMPEIYAMSDILVNSSFIEGLPLTILEAMASKVTIIATRVGAVPSVIRHNEAGLLVNAGDASELAGALESLIADREKRIRFAEAAYKTVQERFTLKAMTDRYGDIYASITGGRGR